MVQFKLKKNGEWEIMEKLMRGEDTVKYIKSTEEKMVGTS
jgi:hypothetical protein